jgi:hypothetical protein
VGLGPGLTPSGDDFIAGFLLGEKIVSLLTVPEGVSQNILPASRIGGTPSPLPSPSTNGTLFARSGTGPPVIPLNINKGELWQRLTRTNDGGRTLLYQTLLGYFPNYLLSVARNVGKAQTIGDMADAVGRAVSHGETSGTDALVGLWFYLNASASGRIWGEKRTP